ncbi:MAG TPA: hypothetical protein VIJ59_11135 [Caulobacteraceae bacterium]
MSDGPWFRARSSGLGWTPITWEGWLITLGLAVIVIGGDLALMAHFGALRPRR